MIIHKNIKRALSAVLYVCVVFSTLVVNSKVIIWDLGKTLVDTSRWGVAFAELGLRDLIGCLPKAAHLEDVVHDTLDLITGMQIESIAPTCNQKGRPLSQGMCNWLAGVRAPQELLDEVSAVMPRLVDEKYFSNGCEQRVIAKAFYAMFNPETLVKHTYAIKDGVKLLQACSDAGHRNMILSNWDNESFKLLYVAEKTAAIFNEIAPEDLIISGDIGLLKPHPSIFEYTISRAGVSASECIFIDDQIENVEAARVCGMHAIHVENGDYKQVARELKALGILG
jgi:haloacid dehalogenase superfamily, subfamily IA, variant 3 with third motif having DD or ED